MPPADVSRLPRETQRTLGAARCRMEFSRKRPVDEAEHSTPLVSHSQLRHGSEVSALTVRSAMSCASWASAPARSTFPRCFLPETVFERSDGRHVRAAELRKSGDVLRGPGHIQVQVLDVVKHCPSERDIICLTTHQSSFHIVADHPVLTKGTHGEPVPVEARSFLLSFSQQGLSGQLFDGENFHEVTHVKQVKRSVQVVDVCFHDEQAVVLAWTFPPCKRRSVRDEAGVACLGRRVADRSASMGVRVRGTFLEMSETRRSSRRCRSEGASSDPLSSWSVGTCSHQVSEPHLCIVCPTHHRYVMDGNEPKRTAPCRHGAGCKFCHAPHPELGRRIRPARHSLQAGSSEW